MTNEQLAEQMQELIDFRDVLADALCDELDFVQGTLLTNEVIADALGQEWMPEVIRAKHRDGEGNTTPVKFKARWIRYSVEIDE